MIALNYTSGTTANPKGVMITHRNACLNIMGHLMHTHMTARIAICGCCRCFTANGWTFVWTITAVGGRHVCLRKADPKLIFEAIAREGITLLCAAPTVLIGIANAPEELPPARRRAACVSSPPARRPPRPPSSASKANWAGRSRTSMA